MHVWTLVKTKAENAENAQAVIEDLMTDTCSEEKRFDYVGSCEVIQMTDEVKQEFNVKNFEELEQKYKDYTTANLKREQERIHEELKLLLLPKYLTHEEAALMVNDKDRRVKMRVEEVLKNPAGAKALPKTLNELVADVAEVLIKSTEDFGSGMLTYNLKGLSELNTSLSYPEEFLTCAESVDCHFIDHTLDEDVDQSQPVFYVLVDRHY